MARGRMLSNSLSTSRKIAALYDVCPKLAEFCRALFPLLVAHADDHGRLPGDEQTIKLKVDPISPRKLPDFVAALQVMHAVDLILWYQVDDRKVIEIVKFAEHQDLKGHDKRPWKLPPCPGPEAVISSKPLQTVSGADLGESGDTTKETKRREEKVTEGKEKSVSSEASSEPLAKALLTFPTVGVEGTSWALTDGLAAEWRAAFPSIDILAEARKALAWLHANPGRRKTTRGMPRFLVSWFSRAQDSGRGNGRAMPTPPGVSKKTTDLMQSSADFLGYGPRAR